jgi:hypothetical protein
MKTKYSKRLVIDTNVLINAGNLNNPTLISKNIREFLLNILEICHRVVVTKKILEEWNNHSSIFSRRWRVSMESKDKVITLDSFEHEKLKNKISSENVRENFSKKDKEAILKDFILIEAALETDKIIISLDTTAEDICSNLSNIAQLQTIKWLKPEESTFSIIDSYDIK